MSRGSKINSKLQNYRNMDVNEELALADMTRPLVGASWFIKRIKVSLLSLKLPTSPWLYKVHVQCNGRNTVTRCSGLPLHVHSLIRFIRSNHNGNGK